MTHAWDALLQEEGRRLGGLLRAGMTSVEMEWMVEQSIERLRVSGSMPRSPLSVGDGVTLMRGVLEPICGAGATQAVVSLAMQRSAGHEAELPGTNWPVFVGNLKETATMLCGLATGRLIARAGACLPIG